MPRKSPNVDLPKKQLGSGEIKLNIGELLQFMKTTQRNPRWIGFTCVDFRYKSAPPSTCSQGCWICSDQFVPMTARVDRLNGNNSVIAMHDNDTAASTIKDLIRTVEGDHAYIRTKIDTHGNAIPKRWQKKTGSEGKQIVLTAMPTIFASRHSDQECLFEHIEYFDRLMHGSIEKEIPKHPHVKRGEGPFLIPFLNAETLSEDKTRLLALMHYLAETHLSAWIAFDRDAIKDEFHSCSVSVAYNPHCVSINLPNANLATSCHGRKMQPIIGKY